MKRAEHETKILEFRRNEYERKKEIRNRGITPDAIRQSPEQKNHEILSAYGAQPYKIPDAQAQRWGSKMSNYGKHSL